VALLTVLLKQRAIVPIVFALILALGSVLFFFVGRDFFPQSRTRSAR
jgi:multidrug efflux pump subunit AcrB